MYKKVIAATALMVFLLVNASAQSPTDVKKTNGKNYEVAVYYFPQWHVDAQNEKTHGYPWTEWEALKTAKPRFEGHQQPKVPLWGYEDEADPKVMAKKIGAIGSTGSKIRGGSSIGTTKAGGRSPNYKSIGSSEAPF